MMIKKVEISFGVGSKGPKTTDFGGILKFKPLFCQSAPTPNHTCRKDVFGCLTTSHQISSRNIDRKILFLNKIKKSTRWPSYFLGLFLAITPKLLRLAAFPRSLKLRK